MDRWTAQVAWLGAELGPEPADDLLPTRAASLAWVAVEAGEAGEADEADDADPEIAAAVAALHRVLGRTPRPWCGPALDAALAGLDPTWAPAQAVRLAAALAAGLHAGHLPAGHPWAVHVEDPVGAAGAALLAVVELLAGLLDAWDLTLAPPAVITNLGSVRRAGSRYRWSDDRLAAPPDLWIELDPRTGADDPLPGPNDGPTAVVRPAPADAADPGLPPTPGLPPDADPLLDAVARWCLPEAEHDAEGRRWAARLFDPSWPDAAVAPDGAPGGDAAGWRREVADLVLAAGPEQAAAWCSRALVEAERAEASRARHRRLVEAAAPRAGGDAALRRHAGELRRVGRGAWALDVWEVADAAQASRLAADVVAGPQACHPAELALGLAQRLEAAVAEVGAGGLLLGGAVPALSSGQTAG